MNQSQNSIREGDKPHKLLWVEGEDLVEYLRGETWATKIGAVGGLWGNQRSDKETREGGREGEEARTWVGEAEPEAVRW